jgi:hypothetical protein
MTLSHYLCLLVSGILSQYLLLFCAVATGRGLSLVPNNRLLKPKSARRILSSFSIRNG